MSIVPIERMWDRVRIAREDSDTSLFLSLMYLGEMVTKIVTAGLAAALLDDRDRHRYRQLHRLVRADGLGEWNQVLEEVLTGPPSQYLAAQASEEKRELIQKLGPGTWQHEAVILIANAYKLICPECEPLPTKVDGRRWFSIFASLRNATRGHGAIPESSCGAVCPDLERSLRLVLENHRLFRRPWAYLHRNLSGKYRVVKLWEYANGFETLKRSGTGNLRTLEDGVYVEFDQPMRVELVESNVDAVDFFFPNGGFNGKRFELISYITGDKSDGDATKYLAPASELPSSETQGHGILEIQGEIFGNLPPVPSGYINRSALEEELARVLLDDRHPVVTLTGRGGIGKTSLALTVLHRIANQQRFECILWFSARDIDLLAQGPKLVRPQILTEKDIANEFLRLFQPTDASAKGFDRVEYLAKALTLSPTGQPLLFVFDNFETVRDKIDLFAWLDTYVRAPNKILITTREREFKGDYPIEVFGMTEQESDELMSAVSVQLGIRSLLTDQYRRDVYKESDGHPYVIKILLGEVAKAGTSLKVERILAGRDELLNALFERTYAGLAPVAKRVFLTLCNWKSTVAQLAVEAVLLRPANEKMDVRAGIEELAQTSFIEISVSNEDNEAFLTVPLVTSVFGKRKLLVSPMKSAIEADSEFLQAFGAAQRSDIRHGIGSRVERVFREVAKRCGTQREKLDDYLPILAFVSRRYPLGWLLLASLHEEFRPEGGIEEAKECIRRYLESGDQGVSPSFAWKRLADHCRKTNDNSGEVHALVEMCQMPDSAFNDVSSTANRLNQLFKGQYLMDMEKRIVVSRLVEVMERRLSEADATDCSRLAWLHLHLNNEQRAMEVVEAGLRLDPNNDYCLRLFSDLESKRCS